MANKKVTIENVQPMKSSIPLIAQNAQPVQPAQPAQHAQHTPMQNEPAK